MLLPAISDLWISPLKHQYCRASGSFFQHRRRCWVESQTPTPEWHFSVSGGCPRMKGKGELCKCYQGAGVSACGHGRWELPTEIPCRESRELSQAGWKHMEITYIMYVQRRVSGYPATDDWKRRRGTRPGWVVCYATILHLATPGCPTTLRPYSLPGCCA